MSFIKGMLMGGAISIGAMYMYGEMSNRDKKNMLKKGKQFVKKLGIM